MKNMFFLFFAFIFSNTVSGQNLHLVFDPNEPDVTKDVRKYIWLRGSTTPVINQCGVGKIKDYYYFFGYPIYAGTDLELMKKEGTVPVSMTIAQSQALYPNAKNGAQLDQALQPAIEFDFDVNNEPESGEFKDFATVKYFKQFAKIFVIEYLPNGQAQVVEVRIMNRF
jgi:hypothetical protein